MMKINDVELSVDLYDAEFAEKYEKALACLNQPSLDKNAKLADTIRHECQKVCEFFDTLFGEGTAVNLFNGRANLNTALDYAEMVVDEATNQRVAMEERTKRYKNYQS